MADKTQRDKDRGGKKKDNKDERRAKRKEKREKKRGIGLYEN